MTKYINCFNHSVTTPEIYQRRFEHDLPEESSLKPSSWQAEATRVAQAALPFFSLYQPFGSVISLTMGSTRFITHLTNLVYAFAAGSWLSGLSELGQMALAALALAATIFNFTLGLFITTGIDILRSAASALSHIYHGELSLALDEAMQMSGSIFYLGIMVTGSLEVALISTLLQAAICLSQAHKEFSQGRFLEGIAKTVLGMIRMHQAGGYIKLIEKRNLLLKVEKLNRLYDRAWKGRAVRHLLDNPLVDLKEQIDDKHVILKGPGEKEYDFGSHFHGHGKGVVKGSNLAFRTVVVNGEEKTELDFKVNHVFKDKIQQLIQEMKGMDASQIKEVLAFAGSHAKGIKISEVAFPLGDRKFGTGYQIDIEGLGSLKVAGDKNYPTLYDKVIVQMDAGKTLFDMHELISFVDLDEALYVSTADDMRRLKMGHLFRTFCPREATPFERSEAFFSLPTDKLQEEMIKKAPKMKEIFEKYLDKMTAHEILPGRVRYAMPGIAKQAHELGGRALTAAVTGAYSDDVLYERVASMISLGMLSSEMRFGNGVNTIGMSSGIDFQTGGADSVFTQMLTARDCKDHTSLSSFYYYSKVQMLISLDALESGSYQYHYDNFGTRLVNGRWFGNTYSMRPSIDEFVSEEQHAAWWDHSSHEVMIKERILPSFFKGVIVRDDKTRDDLLAYLRNRNLVHKNASGTETILDIPVTRFIRVGTTITEELLA